MWQNKDDDECPQEHLNEIATNVTNLGDMVRKLVRAAYKYTKIHRTTEEEESEGRTRAYGGARDGRRRKSQASDEDEYKSTMYFGAISMENERRAEERSNGLASENHVGRPQEISESGTEKMTPQARTNKQRDVALSEKKRGLPNTNRGQRPLIMASTQELRSVTKQTQKSTDLETGP